MEKTFAVITASSTTYATAGTFQYVVSTNACEVDVAAWGAGGAGFDGTNAGGGAGGGGGAFASSTLTNLVIGNAYAIVVGAGGQTSGADGANSTFDSTVVVAEGGKGGTTVTTGIGSGGLAANSTGVTTRDGGTGGAGNGTDDSGGGGGGAAGPHGAGGTGADASTTVGGGGGGGNGGNPGSGSTGGTSTNGGAGGNGDTNGSTAPHASPGTDNANGGGGGGGGDQTSNGGNGGAPGGGGGGGEALFGTGARGQVKITEFINSNGCLRAPTVATNAASGVSAAAATLNGNISSTGGQNATVRGFAWGTNSALSGGDTSTTTDSGSFGTGAFTKAVRNILANRTYYFRAYATNPAGTGYGTILNFTTGTDTTPSRKFRLFQFLKFFSGRIIVQ